MSLGKMIELKGVRGKVLVRPSAVVYLDQTTWREIDGSKQVPAVSIGLRGGNGAVLAYGTVEEVMEALGGHL